MRTEYELGELLEYEQPTKYAVESTKYDDKYSTPVLTAGKSFILGYTNETDGIYDNLPVIIFDDFTTATQYVNFKFKVKSSAMKILKANEELALTKYLYYLMQTIHCDHDTHKRYWIQTYSKIKVEIPNLTEQQRIVDKIEELFSKLDKGVEELEATKKEVNSYRFALIQKLIPKCTNKKISDCILEMGQGWSPKCEKDNTIDNNKWAVIKTSAIQPFNFLYEENKVLPEHLLPREKHELEIGDVLITRAGPKNRCGVCCMVRKTKSKLLNCDKVYRIKVNTEIIVPEYLECVLNSPEFIKEINMCKTGGNDSGLNLTQERFLTIQIPVPELEIQRKLINEIEAHLSVCDKIEQIVNESLQKAESLRQSILKQAFVGKLV